MRGRVILSGTQFAVHAGNSVCTIYIHWFFSHYLFILWLVATLQTRPVRHDPKQFIYSIIIVKFSYCKFNHKIELAKNVTIIVNLWYIIYCRFSKSLVLIRVINILFKYLSKRIQGLSVQIRNMCSSQVFIKTVFFANLCKKIQISIFTLIICVLFKFIFR